MKWRRRKRGHGSGERCLNLRVLMEKRAPSAKDSEGGIDYRVLNYVNMQSRSSRD